jgi:hypothetical protein
MMSMSSILSSLYDTTARERARRVCMSLKHVYVQMRDQSIVREKDNNQCLSSRNGLRAALGRLLWRGIILFGEQWALRVIRKYRQFHILLDLFSCMCDTSFPTVMFPASGHQGNVIYYRTLCSTIQPTDGCLMLSHPCDTTPHLILVPLIHDFFI